MERIITVMKAYRYTYIYIYISSFINLGMSTMMNDNVEVVIITGH